MERALNESAGAKANLLRLCVYLYREESNCDEEML
jgi:hypothetical protein